ncbi:peptidoglycan D,D-transpeptidase FtsI family protein [Actibacterium pelagium]|uniref:Cell division protein FtsI n=1 Tax=Actibacterium pelagium TaxID=2029103 RepID=A0A917AFU2_9RHOB|nr:penicillin-binding protein 2 [Actibacterium pelagium]GGE47400.1 cell division protein FtsI [Actibacterium pelagium]
MIRTPLRPLARVLEAREKGENPDKIERENLRERHEQMRDKSRIRAEGRLLVLGLIFLAGFGAIGGRMATISSAEPQEPVASASQAAIIAQRADITDRNGNVLATNLATHALYAQPHHMIDKARVARELVQIFPDLEEEALTRRFSDGRKFLWIKKKISPEQQQMVHDIGDPGLQFGPREMRLYPNGALAAHILGGASFGREGVQSAEVIGTAGVEKAFDDYLRDAANGGQPLRLSIDLTIQAALERVLHGGMVMMNAKGATAVMMEAKTGKIVAMASLPDFDPNERPTPLTEGDASDSPLFNRAVQGVYELGSTFKIFTAAQAMELGLVNANSLVDADAPMKWGKHKIKEFKNKNYGPYLSVTDVMVKSSNVGTANLALQIGKERQRAFLKELGFMSPTSVELVEAPGAKPLTPKHWGDIHTITVSYGHGLSASPLHLASAYATIANGGILVKPTLLADAQPTQAKRVLSQESAADARSMLRQVVTRGTASFGDVEGYAVGGKTGTADKPKERGGGYYDDKVIATFASMFPAHSPEYVLIVTLDEPEDRTGSEPRRTAGWTAVPVAAEIIRRTAPLMGLRPDFETDTPVALIRTSN